MILDNQDIPIYAGDSQLLSVAVTDISGNAVDISACTVKWAAVRGQTQVIYKDTSNGGVTIDDATHGKYSVHLLSSDTTNLIGTYYHESIIIDTFGNVSTVLVGNLKVSPSYLR